MSSLNRVMLIGNLGKEPEIRALSDGKEVATLTVATSESWKDKHSGERKEKTEWHRVVIFNEGLVGVAKRYLLKGSKVFLEGQLQTRKWTDRDGVEKYSTEVVLQNFNGTLKMLDPKREDGGDDDGHGRGGSGSGISAGQGGSSRTSPVPDLDDEIPF